MVFFFGREGKSPPLAPRMVLFGYRFVYKRICHRFVRRRSALLVLLARNGVGGYRWSKSPHLCREETDFSEESDFSVVRGAVLPP